MDAQAFEAIAERQISAPRKARAHAAEKRRAEKALAERHQQFRHWKCWHAERRDALLAGPYGEPARSVLALLKTLTLDAAPDLIAHIRCGPWADAHPDARFCVLALADAAIVRLRERHGLPPFDDPLLGAPPNAFPILRGLLA
jgi:hypothetical protein